MSGFLLAEFSSAAETEAAVRKAAQAAMPAEDVLMPHPIEGLAVHLKPAPRKARVGWAMFIAGAFGAAGGYFLQWYSAVIAFPFNSGGRPLDSWPVFLLVPYEACILLAGITGLLTWMWMCGLPKLHHPLFAVPIVERATQDRYVIVFPRSERMARWIGSNLKPSAIHEVDE